MSSKSLNSKSQVVTQGNRRAPNRAMLRAVGFSDDDFQKPIVGVAGLCYVPSGFPMMTFKNPL